MHHIVLAPRGLGNALQQSLRLASPSAPGGGLAVCRQRRYALRAGRLVSAAGRQQWRALARQAVLRGKRVAVLEPAAYGGYKDVNEAWIAGGLAVGAWPAVGVGPEVREMPEDLQELWQERAAIMAYDGKLPYADAKRLAWGGPQPPREAR